MYGPINLIISALFDTEFKVKESIVYRYKRSSVLFEKKEKISFSLWRQNYTLEIT